MTRISTFLLAAALVAGCGPTPSRAPPPSAGGLPGYDAREQQLFDDTLAPELFGGAPDASEPLQARARFAEGIVPCQVRTVTRDASGETESFLVDVAPSGAALKGPDPQGSLSLTIPRTSASFALVRSVDSSLVGARLLLFYKRYWSGQDAILHWRAEADTPRVRQVIEQARLMGELGR